jgi:methylenetetrahydrofolate reductase (NADPH)
MPGGYSPDALIEGVSLDRPERKVRGFHLYTFNEVQQTEAWRREALERIGSASREERHEESTI